mgnify:CR=1 FL=1
MALAALYSFVLFRKNMYLKAVIAIKPFKDKKLYVTTNLEEVQDYNQITYFLLSCFLAHSQRVQGFVEPPEEKQQIVSTSFFGHFSLV